MLFRLLQTYDSVGERSPLVSRFSIAILSSVLLGMAIGYVMPPSLQGLAGAAGLFGMFFYMYRIWLVSQIYRASQAAMQSRIEDRLGFLTAPKEQETPPPVADRE